MSKEVSERKCVPRKILAFGSNKKFIAVYASRNVAAKALGVSPFVIASACDGRQISCQKQYLRWWDSEVSIQVEQELGVLTLSEYDYIVGAPKRAYSDNSMKKVDKRYYKKLVTNYNDAIISSK